MQVRSLVKREAMIARAYGAYSKRWIGSELNIFGTLCRRF